MWLPAPLINEFAAMIWKFKPSTRVLSPLCCSFVRWPIIWTQILSYFFTSYVTFYAREHEENLVMFRSTKTSPFDPYITMKAPHTSCPLTRVSLRKHHLHPLLWPMHNYKNATYILFLYSFSMLPSVHPNDSSLWDVILPKLNPFFWWYCMLIGMV